MNDHPRCALGASLYMGQPQRTGEAGSAGFTWGCAAGAAQISTRHLRQGTQR